MRRVAEGWLWSVQTAESRKRDKYGTRCAGRGLAFLPFVISAFGPATTRVLQCLATALSDAEKSGKV